jgi:hypothetical protein
VLAIVVVVVVVVGAIVSFCGCNSNKSPAARETKKERSKMLIFML